MRLSKLVLLIGLAGSLVGCDSEADNPASQDGAAGKSGAPHETSQQDAAPDPTENPDVMPDPLETAPLIPPVNPPANPRPIVDRPSETAPPKKDGEQSKPAGGRAINLKSADSGTTVSAGVGDLVIIELDANPTTGFSWESKPAADDAILKLKSKKYLSLAQLNPEMRPMLGQGGVTTFTYQVVGTGKAAISLVYRRPWEKDVKPAKTFGVEIEATKTTGPVVTGKIVFSEAPDVEKISRIVVSIRNTALADGPSPLIVLSDANDTKCDVAVKKVR
ncbi:MAG: protease inhibitor I42 family protein [Candidatus Nealsonbacteria bacterium]|nr:protease inhibitor I42 family protein [Candidatus Nealsonbacteria bacterium]